MPAIVISSTLQDTLGWPDATIVSPHSQGAGDFDLELLECRTLDGHLPTARWPNRRPAVWALAATGLRLSGPMFSRLPAGQSGFMVARFAQWTFDVRHVERMAEFSAAPLGFCIDHSEDGSVHLRPDEPSRLSVWPQPTEEPGAGKNRDHPDWVSTGGSDEAEIRRLLALGATRADAGQRGDGGLRGAC